MKRHRLTSLVIIAVAISLGLLIPSSRGVAGNEDAAFAQFQQSIRAADPGLVAEKFSEEHPKPTEAEVEALHDSLVQAAIRAAGIGTKFADEFPASQRLPEVWSSMGNIIFDVFGNQGLEVPRRDAPIMVASVKHMLTRRPDDPRLLMLLCHLSMILPENQRRALLNELSKDNAPEPGKSAAKNALRQLDYIGKPMDLHLTAMDGRKINFKEMKDKAYLIDFWSSDSVTCRRDVRDLKKLYEDYHPRGLEIIGMSFDADRGSLEFFLRQHDIKWPQYYDPAGASNSVALSYGIAAGPVYWLVDRDGILRDINAHQDKWESVKALLKE